MDEHMPICSILAENGYRQMIIKDQEVLFSLKGHANTRVY